MTEMFRCTQHFYELFSFSKGQNSAYLSGVKTIRYQSFNILLPVSIHMYLIVIVVTSHQNFNDSMKIAFSHTSLFTNLTKIIKKVLKNP